VAGWVGRLTSNTTNTMHSCPSPANPGLSPQHAVDRSIHEQLEPLLFRTYHDPKKKKRVCTEE